jgi:hypothetical protein
MLAMNALPVLHRLQRPIKGPCVIPMAFAALYRSMSPISPK